MLPREESVGQTSARVRWISVKSTEATGTTSLAHVFFMKQAVGRRCVGRELAEYECACQVGAAGLSGGSGGGSAPRTLT